MSLFFQFHHYLQFENYILDNLLNLLAKYSFDITLPLVKEATLIKGFHSTSAPSNNFSKKVRLFFMVFLSLNLRHNLVNFCTQVVDISNSLFNFSVEFIDIDHFSGVFLFYIRTHRKVVVIFNDVFKGHGFG